MRGGNGKKEVTFLFVRVKLLHYNFSTCCNEMNAVHQSFRSCLHGIIRRPTTGKKEARVI